MLHQLREHGWRRVAIVSARSAAGKTTTTANLALSLARQTDLRSLVLDLDLRRPNLARVLGQSSAYGMADVLEGRIGFTEHGRRFGNNLIFGLTGAPAAHSAELLHSRRTAEALDGLDQLLHPDLCLYDMPPMLAADDTMGFLRNVDCALLVVEAGRGTIAQIDMAERQLAELTNVLGIVLNRCRFPDDLYGYEDGYY
ncbi:CpsD/CapB family tyrosine-protein kinase [Thioclava sp. BHET1]|nr:CpsD/CapB family tyrosine-protein kinase [Thioclava sp. BHET1]